MVVHFEGVGFGEKTGQGWGAQGTWRWQAGIFVATTRSHWPAQPR